MKTQGFKDLYLPQKVAIHVKIVLSTFVIGLVWGLIINAELNLTFFISIVPILIFDLEMAYLLIVWFKKLHKKYGSKLNETSSINKLVFVKLLGLLLFLALFLAVNVIGVFLYLIVSHAIKGLGFPDLLSIMKESNLIKVTAIGLLFSIPFFMFQKWLETLKREHKLKEQNLIFQNETLRSQVNPHFLFNSLNTLSTLINNEVDMANRFIAKLSLIYRYIPDNSVKVKISLMHELDFIKDYFYMHQIRSEGKINLTIDIIEKDSQYEIMPVSLQLLIENAIKHNMATLEKPLKINLFIKDGYIVVTNNIQKMATQINSTKIGLKNLNERVRLVTGKELIITQTEEKSSVKVPLIV